MDFTEDFEHKNKTCFQCNGFYGPCFGQPVCGTCHAFLYPDDALQQANMGANQEKTDDCDSGNEEPKEPGDYYQMQQHDGDEEEDQFQQPQLLQQQADIAQNLKLNTFPSSFNSGSNSSSCSNISNCSNSSTGLAEGAVGGVVGDIDRGIERGFLERVRSFSVDDSGGEIGNSLGLRSSSNRLNLDSDAGNNSGDYSRSGICEASGVGPHLRSVGGRAVEGLVRSVEVIGGGNVINGIICIRSHTGSGITIKDELQERINMLTCLRPPDNMDPTLIHRIPPEVLMLVFSMLDDITLWSVGCVCRRWQQLVARYVSNEQWHIFTSTRWPLFRPLYAVESLCWQRIYTNLTESSPCQVCLHKMLVLTPPDNNENSWRRNRLRNERRTLSSDPPEGIEARPLDKMSLHWQASIRGPAGSPYEGGTFYLYIQIPPSYPLCPPIVRFITKIFHPNVSRHGDIGIDSIQHNWSLALTISKVLISIQSLLTDPYMKVCMEPDIGRLYESNKNQFDKVAKSWTWHYAMHDALIPQPQTPQIKSTALPSTCASQVNALWNPSCPN